MTPHPPRRHRRGTSVLEVTVVLVIFGVLVAGLYATYGAVTQASGEESAKHTLRSVTAAQQLRYESRGAFSDDPSDLGNLEPAWTYVAGTTAAASYEHVSVEVGRHDGADAVAAATSYGTSCVGVVIYDPAVRAPVTGSWDSGDAPCDAVQAFAHAGVEPW